MKATITAAASTYVCALVAVVAVPRCRRLLILTQRGVESLEKSAEWKHRGVSPSV